MVCDKNIEGKKGYAIDILEEIYHTAGYTVVFRNTPWQRALYQAYNGESDVLVGIFKMQETEEATWKKMGILVEIYKSLIYPKQQIFNWNEACFFIRGDSDWRYSDDNSFDGLRFGTVLGYSYTRLDNYLEKHSERDDRLSGDDAYRRNFLKLLNRRIDIALGNEYMAGAILQRMASRGELPQKAIKFVGCYPGSVTRYSYIAFSPKNPQAKKLAQMFDEGIAKMRTSGKLRKILEMYNMRDWAE